MRIQESGHDRKDAQSIMVQVYIALAILQHLVSVIADEIIEMDLLQPYPGYHFDTRRTHRHVRSCQPNLHGSSTYESHSSSTTPSSASYRTDYVMLKTSGSIQYGHRTVVMNPVRMLSVLEPSHSNACSSSIRETVSMSAHQRQCLVATNAGFFDPKKGTCFGNAVSDGRLVTDSKGIQNANFGIRKDGTLVIGYLSEDELHQKDNPFVQLIAGVGWILRNGTSYLDDSLRAECPDTQTTGSMRRFFSVQSARTVVGYDKDGNVHLFQFDGKTDHRGLNLYQIAEYLKSQGILNAINLDGGGSSTFVTNGSVVNYPSDICKRSYGDVLCARNVSTILCVHEPDECVDDSECPKDMSCSQGRCFQESWFKDVCNRNFVLVVVLSAACGLSVLFNVCLCNCYCMMRSRLRQVTSSRSKSEALRNLLRQTDDPYDGSESEWEEEDERAMQMRRLRDLDMIE